MSETFHLKLHFISTHLLEFLRREIHQERGIESDSPWKAEDLAVELLVLERYSNTMQEWIANYSRGEKELAKLKEDFRAGKLDYSQYCVVVCEEGLLRIAAKQMGYAECALVVLRKLISALETASNRGVNKVEDLSSIKVEVAEPHEEGKETMEELAGHEARPLEKSEGMEMLEKRWVRVREMYMEENKWDAVKGSRVIDTRLAIAQYLKQIFVPHLNNL